jgi:uroporphyrinogen-III synthase
MECGPCRIVLRNAAIVVDGEAIDLPPRERAVAASLLARSGRVVSKDALLREAWPEGGADLHAVEVAVGRLRRRVRGPLTIRSVSRRGYMLSAG